MYLYLMQPGFIFGSISAEQLHFHSVHKRSVCFFLFAVKRLPVFTVLSCYGNTKQYQKTHNKSDQSLTENSHLLSSLSFRSPDLKLKCSFLSSQFISLNKYKKSSMNMPANDSLSVCECSVSQKESPQFQKLTLLWFLLLNYTLSLPYSLKVYRRLMKNAV